MTGSQLCLLENVEQRLLEVIADLLDEESTLIDEAIAGAYDPVNREESELHIRMAKAAMVEYKKTMIANNS